MDEVAAQQLYDQIRQAYPAIDVTLRNYINDVAATVDGLIPTGPWVVIVVHPKTNTVFTPTSFEDAQRQLTPSG